MNSIAANLRFQYFVGCMIVLGVGCDQVARVPSDTLEQVSGTASDIRPFPEVTSDNRFKKLSGDHLPNAIRIHEKVLSGGEPSDEAAFNELKTLGVRTIISVDGTKPNLELARRSGMRYVHLPHGYDGISDERARELAFAVQTLEGPIYIHCHHGKHRSPAASAVACVMSGLIESSIAASILHVAGTNPNYVGLYAAVARSRKLKDVEWNSISPELPETANLPPLAEAMVALDHSLEAFERGWAHGTSSSPETKNSELVHQSLLLKEHFAEMLRLECVAKQPQKFRDWLIESEAYCASIMRTIESQATDLSEEARRVSVGNDIAELATRCTQCHRFFRDSPR